MRKVESIVVVGGGTSGWMTAAHLSRMLLGVEITLVESPHTPVIGVGEATIPFIRGYMERLGFDDEKDWMRRCDATYKTGILFESWLSGGDTYWHPFEYLDYLDTHVHTGHCWLQLRESDHPRFRERSSFYRSFFPSTTLNLANGRIPSGESGYAYHFDAGLFVELLRESAPAVRTIVDDVVEVGLGEQAEIRELVTASHGRIRADLYVDCTGFRRLLMSRVAPTLELASYADSLFCDRALVVRPPYEVGRELGDQIHPFVKASARSAGWIWAIPLYSKLSSGYVYSSAFLSDDEAERELRRFWGESRLAGVDARRIEFTTGQLTRHWVGNCVAIGLSAGFIEPLESTGLAFIQIGAEMLASMLDGRHFDDSQAGRYTAHLDKAYRDVLQFIIAHYALTDREDTAFWKAVKHDTRVPEDLAARLEVFRRHLPTNATKGTSEVWMFRDISWFCVLLGMNFEFETPRIAGAKMAEFKNLLATKRRSTERLLRKLPSHYDYLRREVYREGGS